MNEGYRPWRALKSALSNRGLGIKDKKYLYKGVIVPTALYGAEAWGMRSAERRKVNVLEMKCLKSLVRMSRMDRVKNEEVRRRAGIELELASRADKGKVFQGQEPRSGESTTTECGFNYQLLAVMY